MDGEDSWEQMKGNFDSSKFEGSDIKSIISTLRYIIDNARLNGVTREVLNDEVQQLGFLKEHAAILSKLYCDTPQDSRRPLDTALSLVDGRISMETPMGGVVLSHRQANLLLAELTEARLSLEDYSNI